MYMDTTTSQINDLVLHATPSRYFTPRLMLRFSRARVSMTRAGKQSAPRDRQKSHQTRKAYIVMYDQKKIDRGYLPKNLLTQKLWNRLTFDEVISKMNVSFIAKKKCFEILQLNYWKTLNWIFMYDAKFKYLLSH